MGVYHQLGPRTEWGVRCLFGAFAAALAEGCQQEHDSDDYRCYVADHCHPVAPAEVRLRQRVSVLVECLTEVLCELSRVGDGLVRRLTRTHTERSQRTRLHSSYTHQTHTTTVSPRRVFVLLQETVSSALAAAPYAECTYIPTKVIQMSAISTRLSSFCSSLTCAKSSFAS